MAISLRPLRLDLDVNRNRLADAGHCLSRRGEHQIEIASHDGLGRHGPARPGCLIHRRRQLHMKRDRSRHPMHGEIADNVAALRSRAFHAAALKSDLRKLFHVEEFGAAQVVVPFLDVRVDAAHIDLRCDRGILRTLPIDIDFTAESHEFSVGGTEELMDAEPNR